MKKNFGRSNIDVCTFGGPRVGKIRFRINFNQQIDRCFRVTNRGDIVPHVPSKVTLWNHVGLEIEVNGRMDKPHSLDAYLAGLQNIGQPAEVTPFGGEVPESAVLGGIIAAPTL